MSLSVGRVCPVFTLLLKRVAVCVAGAARALIHPLVWRSLERHVLGRSEGGEGGHDLFAVLGTGAEDQRSRTNELPLDEQPSLRSAAGAYLLSHALSALRPKAVRLVVGTANASCGIPASGHFSKWADCVDLVGLRRAWFYRVFITPSTVTCDFDG